jgi:hypothetical protein
MTIQSRLISALEAQGAVRVPGRWANGMAKLTDPKRPGKFWFVGSAGALRHGRNRATSLSMSDAFKDRLLGVVKETVT